VDAFGDAMKAAAKLGAELHRTTNQLPHVLKSAGKLTYCLTGEEIMLKTRLILWQPFLDEGKIHDAYYR